jgi:hypothetical protein
MQNLAEGEQSSDHYSEPSEESLFLGKIELERGSALRGSFEMKDFCLTEN